MRIPVIRKLNETWCQSCYWVSHCLASREIQTGKLGRIRLVKVYKLLSGGSQWREEPPLHAARRYLFQGPAGVPFSLAAVTVTFPYCQNIRSD